MFWKIFFNIFELWFVCILSLIFWSHLSLVFSHVPSSVPSWIFFSLWSVSVYLTLMGPKSVLSIPLQLHRSEPQKFILALAVISSSNHFVIFCKTWDIFQIFYFWYLWPNTESSHLLWPQTIPPEVHIGTSVMTVPSFRQTYLQVAFTWSWPPLSSCWSRPACPPCTCGCRAAEVSVTRAFV